MNRNAAAAATAKSQHGTTHYRQTRVLVVDDQPVNREIVKGLLAVCEVEADLATNGQEAVERLKEAGPQAYDLVLMDVQMPVLDGLAATRAVRELPGFDRLPIIAITAHTMAHEIQRAITAGMSDNLGKPFDRTRFYAMLERWIPTEKQFCPIDHPPATTATTGGFPALDGVDTAAGLALVLGDEARYRHWLMSFTHDGPACLTQARQALAAGDRDAAAIAIHTLKGRSGMLGMTALQALAARLEAAIEANMDEPDARHKLEQAVETMCSQIRATIGEAPSAPAPASGPGTPITPDDCNRSTTA